MKKQNITCLIGRAVAAKLGEEDGLRKGRWGCCGMVPGMALHSGGCTGVPQPRACGWRVAVRCHRDSAGEVCLAFSGSKAFISVWCNPCTLQPARHLCLQPLLWKPCVLPGNWRGYCADLALSEKQILIIYVQLVWFWNWLSYWYYLCC